MEHNYKILAQNFFENKTFIIFQKIGKSEKIIWEAQQLQDNKNVLDQFHPKEIELINYIAKAEYHT